MIIIGIDPGLSGAIAILPPDGSIQVFDTPTMAVKRTGKTKAGKAKTKNIFLEDEMAGILKHYPKNMIHVFMEKVHAMPKQGGVSNWSMGEGFGIWRGIFAALDLRRTFITPQDWKKAMGLPKGAEKKESCYRAKQLFPTAELFGPMGGALDGRGDALLIAEYGRRSLNQNAT